MLRVLLIYGVKGPRGPEVLRSRGPVFTVCQVKMETYDVNLTPVITIRDFEFYCC